MNDDKDEDELLMDLRRSYDKLKHCSYIYDEVCFVQDKFNDLTMRVAAFILKLEEE